MLAIAVRDAVDVTRISVYASIIDGACTDAILASFQEKRTEGAGRPNDAQVDRTGKWEEGILWSGSQERDSGRMACQKDLWRSDD